MNQLPHKPSNKPRRWFPAAVLLAGLSLTLFATFYTSNSLRIRDRAQFETAAQHVRIATNTRIENQITLLRGLAAYFAADPNMTSAKFRAYVNRLRLAVNYPGIQGVGFCARLTAAETNALTQSMRRLSVPNFHIWPPSDEPDLYSILFLEPEDERNLAAIGYNMHTDPERRHAMDQARDTGRRAATGRVTLVQEIDGHPQPGFLIYTPIYDGDKIPETVTERRDRLKGFIYSPIRTGDFLQSILNRNLGRMEIKVFDGNDTRAENLIFDLPSPSVARHWLAFAHAEQYQIDVAGCIWTARVAEDYPFDGAFWIVPLLFAVGAALSLTLFYFTLAEERARRATEKSAEQLRTSEQALRNSETRLRLILENARDYAIFSMDLAGRVTSWNSGAEEIFGYTEAEMLGQSGSIIFTPEDLASGAADAEMSGAIKSGLARDDRWHQRKDGTRLFVSGVVRPMTDAAGQNIGFIKVARDITDRLEAEEKVRREKEFSETIINSLPALFYLFDEKGRWLRWNKNTEFVTGYSGEEIRNRTPLDFFQTPDREKVALAVQQTFENGQAIVEAELTTHDGRRLPYLFFGRRIALNSSPCLIGMGIDIGERLRVEQELRAAEERLRHYTVELEQRVAERTAHLRQSLQSLEGLLYHVAHDLRAPLRAMASFTRILLDDYGTTFDARGIDYAQRILVSAQFMDELVQDLLAYGRLAHTTVTIYKVSLQSQVDAVLEQLSDEIKQKQARIEVQRPLPLVKANTTVLNQILLNLIGNALKFVPEGAAPIIRIWAETGHSVRLWIEDNGIGIRPEYHARIFRVFERLHNATQYPGTGIGLAIVQKGVERMGGRVGLESQPGQGSRFWIELPKAE